MACLLKQQQRQQHLQGIRKQKQDLWLRESDRRMTVSAQAVAMVARRSGCCKAGAVPGEGLPLCCLFCETLECLNIVKCATPCQ